MQGQHGGHHERSDTRSTQLQKHRWQAPGRGRSSRWAQHTWAVIEWRGADCIESGTTRTSRRSLRSSGCGTDLPALGWEQSTDAYCSLLKGAAAPHGGQQSNGRLFKVVGSRRMHARSASAHAEVCKAALRCMQAVLQDACTQCALRGSSSMAPMLWTSSQQEQELLAPCPLRLLCTSAQVSQETAALGHPPRAHEAYVKHVVIHISLSGHSSRNEACTCCGVGWGGPAPGRAVKLAAYK